ncbi:MAG: VanW family protein [Desulfotomaculaceae bacterium]|nr:VanW family protein [Desulfotomaculaceae bacterium]
MKKYCLLFLTCLLAVIIPLGPAQAAADNQAIFVVDNQKYSVNGAVYLMDAAPYIAQDRVLVPLRYLAYALGLGEKEVIWNESDKSVELLSLNNKIRLEVNSRTLYVSEIGYQMDVAPVIRGSRVYLPARWVSEALGYSVGWEGRARAVLIGRTGNLPGINKIPLNFFPVRVRPCPISESDLMYGNKLSSTSILFTGDYANVYNAGVAAGYVDGFVLGPQQVFSFNQVVGKRTGARGFIIGHDAWNIPTTGGGVCRTSTVLFQVAKKAGFDIIERHSHYPPVSYTPPGTDATVSWGSLDLKFKNNLDTPVIIRAGLDDKGNRRLLWAELWESRPLTRIDLAILMKEPETSMWDSIEQTRLVAVLKNDVPFISINQLSDLLRLSPEEISHEGRVGVAFTINNHLVEVYEGINKIYVNGIELQLAEAPFILPEINCGVWLPLHEMAELIGAELLWFDSPQPQLLLNLSGSSMTGE